MTVKELKKILNNYEDNMKVEIGITDIYYSQTIIDEVVINKNYYGEDVVFILGKEEKKA